LEIAIFLAVSIVSACFGSWISRLLLKAGHVAATERLHREEADKRQETEVKLRLLEGEMQLERARGLELNGKSDASSELATAARVRQSAAEERANQIPVLEARLAKSDGSLEKLTYEAGQLKADVVRLETSAREERKSFAEKLEILNEAKTKLSHEFENLAAKIFEEKSSKFVIQNQKSMEGVVVPLREQILEFKTKIEQTHMQDSKDRSLLAQEIGRLKELNLKITTEAQNLTVALKGDRKKQGSWGELVLARVLESAGLPEGIVYHTQVHLRDAEDQKFIPDCIIQLPGNKQIIIDSKVSLSAYERYCSANDIDKPSHLRDHVIAIENHIKGLSEKSYENLKGINSLDFVLMFMPIESAFIAAVRENESLLTAAFRHGIHIVGPSNLLITLKIIENCWKQENQSKNVQEIAQTAADLYDKFVTHAEFLADVGKKLDSAKDSYTKAWKGLNSGPGNIIRKLESFKILGARPKKEISADLVTDESSQQKMELIS
jgi:DNA recombination protein RmuC